MIKNIFYFVIKHYVKITRYFFFSSSEIIGLEKLPLGNPIIYSCNHQNAFMDALWIGSISPIKMASTSRSDIFGNHIGRWFLEAFQMMPIYRRRDGFNKISKNEEAFQKVREKLQNNQAVIIFSEGNHSNDYFLRPLSKGSSRIAFESQEKMMKKDIFIVPIGLNYYHHQIPHHKLSIIFGDAIKVKDYLHNYQKHKVRGANLLKEKVQEEMKKCLILPEEDETYLSKRELINRKNEYLSFHKFRALLKEQKKLHNKPKELLWLRKSAELFGIINFPMLLILRKILSSFKDIVFHGSIKWMFAAFVFPIYWLMLFGISIIIWNWQIGLLVFVSAVLSTFIRQRLIKWSSPLH